MTSPALRDAVFSSLDEAVANGYGPTLKGWTATEIACDLIDCDASIAAMVAPDEDRAEYEIERIVPHVEAWRGVRGL